LLYLELNKGKNPIMTWFEGAHFSSKCVRISWHHFDYRGFEFEEWIQIERKYLSDQHFRNLKNFLGMKKDRLVITMSKWCKTFGIPYKTQTWDTFY